MDTVEPIRFQMTYVDRQDPNKAETNYDKELDTLFIDLHAPRGPRATYYLSDGVHVVYDPSSNEVVGFRVEDWELVFLRHHSDLRRPWHICRLLCWISRVCVPFRFLSRDRIRVIERIEQYALTTSSA